MQQQKVDAVDATGDATCTHRAIHRGIGSASSRDDSLDNAQHYDDTERTDQKSVRYLVNHLHFHPVRDLSLISVRFSNKGLNVLLAYFASDTATVTKVSLVFCDFGPLPTAEQAVCLAVTCRHVHRQCIRNIRLDDLPTGLLFS
jgi:hypothetical protein